ncbi:Malonyl CoA-acyl carrier protein transacylase [Rhodococcus sp. B50]|nr:Malonyl CoA-acyl carrier protein transacylase [Rhodococcus sp. B50]
MQICGNPTNREASFHRYRHLAGTGFRCSLVIVISLLAPGQGSQTPGMLAPWLEQSGARDRIDQWSQTAGLDLARLGTTATADEITDTAVTQPLVVASALLAFEDLDRRGLVPADTIVAGHSVGELAAAAIAGVISADDAVALAAIRGAEMARACAIEPTGMSAVLGGAEDEVLARLAELDLTPANMNAAGQIVAAGRLTALEELAANPPEKARVRALPVAGAFHTRFMAPAQDAVAAAAAKITPSDPTHTLLSNYDGKPVTSGADALERLAAQVTRPVRWDLCTVSLRDAQVSRIVELPPAGTLVGIAKREMRGTPTVALKTPAEISALAESLQLG